MPSILSISSHIVAGRVGLSASSFALQRLGFDVWALPTVLYPVTPAPDAAPGASVPQEIFERLIGGLSPAMLGRLSALHIGYLRTEGQVRATEELIAHVRAAAPHAVVLLDPILGDAPGGLYIPAEIADAIKQILLRQVDAVTPNRFELGFLWGGKVDSEDEAIEAARALGVAQVVVTSAPGSAQGKTSTLLIDRQSVWRLRTPLFPAAPHGTGDLLAALFLARRLSGEAGELALGKAVGSVHDLIAIALRDGLNHLPIVEHQSLLIEPHFRVAAEAIDAP